MTKTKTKTTKTLPYWMADHYGEAEVKRALAGDTITFAEYVEAMEYLGLPAIKISNLAGVA